MVWWTGARYHCLLPRAASQLDAVGWPDLPRAVELCSRRAVILLNNGGCSSDKNEHQQKNTGNYYNVTFRVSSSLSLPGFPVFFCDGLCGSKREQNYFGLQNISEVV